MNTIYQILYGHSKIKMPELADLDYLKDKVAKGLYLKEYEVRELKRLVKKYNHTKLTTNHVITVLTKIRQGQELYI